MAKDFHLLAGEAIVAPFSYSAMGIWPREVGEDHT